MTQARPLARRLALLFLSGEWTQEEITHRARSVLTRRKEWKVVDQLVERVIRAFGEQPPPPTLRNLTDQIQHDPAFRKHLAPLNSDLMRRLDFAELPPPVMTPSPALTDAWLLPSLVTPGVLADWLGLSSSELEWFADHQGRERRRKKEPLRHYRYRQIAKQTGGRRLLEMPKPRLKNLQRMILQKILNRVAPHEAAHAFRPGRSIASFAGPHSAKRIVLRIDLRNFFPSVRYSRIMSLFRTIGYPEAIARLLCGLCTNSAPDEILRKHTHDLTPLESRRLHQLYGSPHLPQGAPTSPALANLSAWRLDCRLSGLVTSIGADYTRYADDLVFSGGRELEHCLSRFRVLLLAIVLDEGFAIQNRKTSVMRAGGRQQVAGIVVNEHPNLDRAEFDRLKAILFNCAKHGPQSQISRGISQQSTAPQIEQLRNHLTGKIAFVRMINPAKAERLQRLFANIDWNC